MIPSTDEENKSYKEQKECRICNGGFCYDKNLKKDFKWYQKVRDHCHYTGKFKGAAHSICNLCYEVSKKLPILIHNRSTYDDHFIIKQLTEEFRVKFECLGENTEKKITFSAPIKKEIVNDNDEEDDDDSKEEEQENDCGSEEKEIVNIKQEEDNNSKKKKKTRTKYSLLIAIDLCQANYQILLITCQESLIKNPKNSAKEKNLG